MPKNAYTILKETFTATVSTDTQNELIFCNNNEVLQLFMHVSVF